MTSRLWGLAMDKVISAEIVLANGTVATASKDVNPDLFFVRDFPLQFDSRVLMLVPHHPGNPRSRIIFRHHHQTNCVHPPRS